jgi:hypothetical protein
MNATLSCLATAALLATALPAQTPNNLIALTRTTPILAQRDHNNCAQLPFCNPPGFPPAPAQLYAGGTAWDPIRNGAWISNGTLLAEVDPNTCNYICPPAPAPLVSPNAVVTGLEMVETLNQVWMLDSFGNLYQMQYACPPIVLSMCNTGLALTATNATGGLAVDEKNRLVFYAYSNWAAATTTIHVATMANPCQIMQTFTAVACPGSLLRSCTGLAVDCCREVLYMTDGILTVAWNYTVLVGPAVAFGLQTCCLLPPPVPGDTYIGLGVRSGGATPFGPGCANGACPACPMVHSLRNSPNLGNAQFGLDLSGAPLGSLTWCAIGVGPCAGPGLLFPPLCGPLFTGPLLGTLGPVATPAGFGCGGFAGFNLPLPMIPAFCGSVLSSQCVTFCITAAGNGTALSNCLSWELQGN